MASRVAASDTLLGSGVGRAAIVGFCGFRLPAGLNDAVRFADTETPVDDQDYQEVPPAWLAERGEVEPNRVARGSPVWRAPRPAQANRAVTPPSSP